MAKVGGPRAVAVTEVPPAPITVTPTAAHQAPPADQFGAPAPVTAPESITPATPISRTPPALTGTVRMNGPTPLLETRIGTFEIMNVPDFSDEKHTLPAIDLRAYVGQQVTVRGWPEDGWVPGQTGTPRLAISEFAPGSSAAFAAGRVVVDADHVYVRASADKQVRIDDPALAAALRGYDTLGVIIPATVEQRDDVWTLTNPAPDILVLAGFAKAKNLKTKGSHTDFVLELAHGKTLTARVPSAALDAVPLKVKRHFFTGHFEGGRFVGTHVSAAAGPPGGDPARVRPGVPAGPNAAFRARVEGG